jgi:hypothetical protein
MQEAEVGEIVLQEQAHDRRVAVFSALLAGESGLGTDGMTVVGGSAIEIYTQGDYVSKDVDLVLDSRSRVTAVLKRWGFRDEGKGWSKPEWNLFIDPMQTRDSGSRRLTQIISTSHGSFRISGVEDLIIRRVREAVAWQGRQEALSHALLLLKRAGSNLDWNYLKFFAQREGWEDQLSLLRKMAG